MVQIVSGYQHNRRARPSCGLLPGGARSEAEPTAADHDRRTPYRPRRDHVVLIGFGQAGFRLAQTLRERGVAVIAVERSVDAP